MKLTAYILGTISTMLFVIGVLFKIQHWCGAGVLLTIGMCLFAIFIPFFAIYKYKKED